ncbi:hypothetical protein [Notoacmeibacter sp. MSK16QG-6]|uniref:hypothetical protein n=1 Tax=Notoacmeibacter sp. MSK16QG-6 TaxID=2957982 RepID=UPI0020A168C9|nr:hypothetical protein [Notoacmeibacter sp. MSK16QG-6]MCP1198990.1 hypothetical protein [Notoacmeibacter sp. MSK16QG-6]
MNREETDPITHRDLIFGAAITIVMATFFVWFGGLPLLGTFVPGLIFAWGLLWKMKQQKSLPDGPGLYPLYFGALAWQFIHFTEEYLTGFRTRFPELFGSAAYSAEFFVEINMISYSVFVLAFILAFEAKKRFLLIPVLFFTVYGAIGNAIAHTYWVFTTGDYFPGFLTAQLYWLLGPLLLARLIGSVRLAIQTTIGFAVVLMGSLALTMN